MTNEIVRQDNSIRTWDNKRVRTSREELVAALAPMFVAFPNLEMSDETFAAYYMMLSDLDANRLAAAVVRACQAHEYPTHLITVAAIRKAYGGEREPGPSSHADPKKMKPVPSVMYRPSPEEDREARRKQLARSGGIGGR
jgi:hypothetical protein